MSSPKISWIVGIWLGLFFLFLPFPLHLFPEIGAPLSKLLLPVTHWISGIPLETLEKTGTFSDSIHLFVQSGLLGLVAIPFGLLLQKNQKAHAYFPILPALIAYILAFFLLKYGLEKFTRLQFPIPPANLLYTPLGQLDKDLLFWTSMGTSQSYGWFMGFVEIFAGILLLARKFRVLGAIMATGIFSNVLAINIGFDITVKLLSLMLLLSALYLLSPHLVKIYRFLTGTAMSPLQLPANVNFSPFYQRIAKGRILAIIALECGLPIIEHLSSSEVHTTLQNSTFEITEIAQSPTVFEVPSLRRIHFHRDGYLITESTTGQFNSHKILGAPAASHFTIDGSSSNISFTKKGKTYSFYQNDALLFRAIQLKNADLPLLQDEIHWTVESFIPK